MRSTALLIASALLISGSSVASGWAGNAEAIRQQNDLLVRFAGDWRFERYSPPAEGSGRRLLGRGTITAEMVGDHFAVSRWSGDQHGERYKAFQALGYDVETREYTGAWLDSLLDYQQALAGTFDEVKGEFTLATTGADLAGDAPAFRQRYQFMSPGAMTILEEVWHDGEWTALSITHLTRQWFHPSTVTK